jgi:hypothetical protein
MQYIIEPLVELKIMPETDMAYSRKQSQKPEAPIDLNLHKQQSSQPQLPASEHFHPIEVSPDISLILNMINTKLVLHKFPADEMAKE